MEKKKNDRTRNYATIIYPESAPCNWKELLLDLNIAGFISPLHDKDTYTEEDEKNGKGKCGDLKKPHYHVLLMFDSVKTINQVKAIIEVFGGVGTEVVQNPSGYAQYLCHLNRKDKFQYSTSEVFSMCNKNYAQLIADKGDTLTLVIEMIKFIQEEYIKSFSALVDYSVSNRHDWLSCLMSNSYIIREYLKSRTNIVE